MKKEVLDGILNALEWAVSDVDDIAKAARKGEDVDLRSMIIDSFQFISFIMDVEDQLNIEVPDELLVYDHLASLLGFAELMSTVKEEYEEEEYEEEEYEEEEYEEEEDEEEEDEEEEDEEEEDEEEEYEEEEDEEEEDEEEEDEEEEDEDQDEETELNVLDRTMRGPWSGFLR